MIGQRVESSRGLPWVAIVLLVAGLGLVVTGETQGARDLTVLAVLPLVVSGALWLLTPYRHFAASFTDRAIEVRLLPRDESTAARHTPYSGNRIGIILKVEGAEIQIPEIYDRPLYVIHERMVAAWGRPES